MTQIEQHEKCINILELINSVDDRLARNKYTLKEYYTLGFETMIPHYLGRIKIDTEIVERLKKYYSNNLLKLIK